MAGHVWRRGCGAIVIVVVAIMVMVWVKGIDTHFITVVPNDCLFRPTFSKKWNVFFFFSTTVVCCYFMVVILGY